MTHHRDCGWHVDQYPFECTCGLIGDADLLRAQLLGQPLPASQRPDVAMQEAAAYVSARTTWPLRDVAAELQRLVRAGYALQDLPDLLVRMSGAVYSLGAASWALVDAMPRDDGPRAHAQFKLRGRQ